MIYSIFLFYLFDRLNVNDNNFAAELFNNNHLRRTAPVDDPAYGTQKRPDDL